MEMFFRQIQETLRRGHRGALATIVKRKGAVPRREGAHLFVGERGNPHGTIGGGGFEAEVIKIATRCAQSSIGYLKSFTLVEGEDPSDMVCGGNVTVLIEPVSLESEATFTFLVDALVRHVPVCFIRLLLTEDQGDSRIHLGMMGGIRSDGSYYFPIPVEENLKRRLFSWGQVVLKDGSRTIRMLGPDILELPLSAGWNLAVFESLHVFPRLVIFGGGHLSKALCTMASFCNFRVEVIDDREEFADKARFPEASRVFHLPGYQRIPEIVTLDTHTFVVIATRGHRFDEEVLFQIAGRPVAYIGMVGSRQKNAIVFERLRERGISQSLLERVHAPIGLPIHSETPEEIAVSILAEMIQSRGVSRNMT